MHPVQFALLMKLAGSRVDGTVDTQPAALRRGRILAHFRLLTGIIAKLHSR